MKTINGAYAALGCVTIAACSAADGTTEPANQLPEFNAPLLTIDYRERYEHRIVATDPDGDPVQITVNLKPQWLAYDGATQTLSGVPDWDNRGDHGVSITASDGKEQVSQVFTITVTMGPIDCNVDFGSPDSSLYILPFKVSATYRIIQSYCPPNPAWGHHDAFAYDFDTQIGDTIIASRAGTVILVKEDSQDNTGTGGANTLYIRHADGSQMQYVHFTQNGVLVEVGDYVEQGQPIALSGNTGLSSGPHVHLWLFRDNTVFTREGTLPINFRNADGPLDENRGLVHLGTYTALPFEANNN